MLEVSSVIEHVRERRQAELPREVTDTVAYLAKIYRKAIEGKVPVQTARSCYANIVDVVEPLHLEGDTTAHLKILALQDAYRFCERVLEEVNR